MIPFRLMHLAGRDRNSTASNDWLWIQGQSGSSYACHRACVARARSYPKAADPADPVGGEARRSRVGGTVWSR